MSHDTRDVCASSIETHKVAFIYSAEGLLCVQFVQNPSLTLDVRIPRTLLCVPRGLPTTFNSPNGVSLLWYATSL